MNAQSRPVDKVRASRDGHEFHETWAARKALQLLLPTDDLIGIAVEGLAPIDSVGAAPSTVEIADLTLYYGVYPSFERANRVVTLQFKYSIGQEAAPFRLSDAKKTIQKFSAAFQNQIALHGASKVECKLEFELITNRPILPALDEALSGIAAGKSLRGEVKQQANQFMASCGLVDTALVQFARKVKITGLAGSLHDNKRDLSRVLVNWSSAPDAIARARLHGMRRLIRDKAGSEGEGANVVTRTDVIDALELQSEEDLFPCPAGFPQVSQIIQREQLREVAELIPTLKRPLLVHAAGGIGKTVFLQSLSKTLSRSHQTVLFDCFGGGAYRAPEDSRHLPKRGLIHIVNSLACEGLCDPLLPTSSNVDDLIKASRRRLSDTVQTIRQASPDKQLLLFIDAVDNAAEHAKEKADPCFPTLLLESLEHTGGIPGLQVIVSCRSHRRALAKGSATCQEMQLEPFSAEETKKYLYQHLPDVTPLEINVAYARSDGNPRILEHLASSDRGLLDSSEIAKPIKLDDLLIERIQKALTEARKRGYKEQELNAFLAGLSVLPPPVPIGEYADAHQIDVSAIESFAADLAPLLERTKHGMMFRDEPTETFIRDNYAADIEVLRRIADNLFNKQDSSVYAARALPNLLRKLRSGDLLFKLAFDERVPTLITSTVGKQTIRYARLKAAVLQAADSQDYNQLVPLLSELSTIAGVNERGTDYILKNPDLVVRSSDVDATRRLFEARTKWPGTRHSRLAIATVLSGDLNEASRHFIKAIEWIYHYHGQSDSNRFNKVGPEPEDIAAVPLFLIAENRASDAVAFCRNWKEWYGYEVSERLFSYLNQINHPDLVTTPAIRTFLAALTTEIGVLAGALSFAEWSTADRRNLISKLSKACSSRKDKVEVNTRSSFGKLFAIDDGLLGAAAIAVSIGKRSDALSIVGSIPDEIPSVWSVLSHFSDSYVFPWICRIGIRAAAKTEPVTVRSLLPKDLLDLSSEIPPDVEGLDFREALKVELQKRFEAQQKLAADQRTLTYGQKEAAERFVNKRLNSILQITQAFERVISSDLGKVDDAFISLAGLWAELTRPSNDYDDMQRGRSLFNLLGKRLLVFSLWVRTDLKGSSVEVFLTELNKMDSPGADILIQIVGILSRRPHLHSLCGSTAVTAKLLIEGEDETIARASFFAKLSRAILPASSDEAASLFRLGLEQMDVIGSGDYQFTNELLMFAASLSGAELEEPDFHALTNICELNLPEEEEKFPWLAFARALSKTSGCRGLAKLGRWEDRTRVSLEYTLLPYLTVLIEDRKIEPDMALALLRLAEPAELYVCNSASLATAIHAKQFPDEKDFLSELIVQYHENNPGFLSSSFADTVGPIAKEVFGPDAKESIYFLRAAPRFEKARTENNEYLNHSGTHPERRAGSSSANQRADRRSLRQIVARTRPCNEVSMSEGLSALEQLSSIHNSRAEFLCKMRAKTKFSERVKYLEMIAHLESLSIYTKLEELRQCKNEWSSSLTSLGGIYKAIGIALISTHSAELVSNEYLSAHLLKQLADLCEVSAPALALELIKIFAAPDEHLGASIWMALASIMGEKADPGVGQAAISRLLNGNATKLASSVVDGGWKSGLYPPGDPIQIAVGLVWLKLGSPSGADRWRAAHSVRCFARFGKWEVIDGLVRRMLTRTAEGFQASERSFHFLDARLWLLIALARIAIDDPSNIARYEQSLRDVALDKDFPHVLIRHFASQALLSCAQSGKTQISHSELERIRNINNSQIAPKIKNRQARSESVYENDWLGEAEKSPSTFSLDYDFDKYDVRNLADIFGRPGRQIRKSIDEIVRGIDKNAKSMYDMGGRPDNRNIRLVRGVSSEYHGYGQQLGWHSLLVVAGQLLARHPVIKPQVEDPWQEWLNHRLLTRPDGLWLADGSDLAPIDIHFNLLERGEKGPALTADKRKLLKLIGADSAITRELVVEGHWSSPDQIRIDISSALVSMTNAKLLAWKLAKEKPYNSWLPHYEHNDDSKEYQSNPKEDYGAWIVTPSPEIRLDEDDPLGAVSAVRRPYFASDIRAVRKLISSDPFNRTWFDSGRGIMARCEAWREARNSEVDRWPSGGRLICSSTLLRDVLVTRKAQLMVLIKLQRYEKGAQGRPGTFSYTTAAITINSSMRLQLFKGASNQLLPTR
jgi:hypothetical protein